MSNLTGLFVWSNVVELGYLPMESLDSIYPILDQVVIAVNPRSGDGTLGLVRYVRENYLNVTVIDVPWNLSSPNGEAIGDASNLALRRIPVGDWVFNVQADEILSPALAQDVGAYWRAWAEEYNIVAFKYLHTLYKAQIVQEGAGYDFSRKLALQDGTLRFTPDAWKFDVDSPTLLRYAPDDQTCMVHLHHFRKESVMGQMKNSISLFSEGWTSEAIDRRMNILRDVLDSEIWISRESPFADCLTPSVKSLVSEV